MRPEVQEFVAMGPLPDSASAAQNLGNLKKRQRLLDSIATPISVDEAEALAVLFGPDDCFGLAWTLVHLIETAPECPIVDRISASDNSWIAILQERSSRGA
jgi:hypothetical protein